MTEDDIVAEEVADRLLDRLPKDIRTKEQRLRTRDSNNRCPATIEKSKYTTLRCYRPKGHRGNHMNVGPISDNVYACWKDPHND